MNIKYLFEMMVTLILAWWMDFNVGLVNKHVDVMFLVTMHMCV